MADGYTRQASISNGNVGDASLWNSEYDQLVAAFNAINGHNHDGTAGGGAPIAGVDITYDDSTSSMGTVNVQDAVELLDDRVDTVEGLITTGSVLSIDGQTGIVTLADINLDNVDNTTDLNKPVSTATQAALDALDLGDIDPSPATSLQVIRVNAGGTALEGNALDLGDIDPSPATALQIIRVNSGGTALEGFVPSSGVLSIAGQTGVVTLADINLDNVDNTSDLGKPVSTATQTVLDNLAVTDLEPGTATALQAIRVNAGATALEGFTFLGSTIDFQEFTTSGTWTKPANAIVSWVEDIGGGGGGHNITGTSDSGGGGGGAFNSAIFLESDLGSTETVTIGAGGPGGTNGVTEVGAAGGDTSFGAHLTAIGGQQFVTGNTLSGGNAGGGEQHGLGSNLLVDGNGGYSSGGGGGAGGTFVGNGGNCVKGGAGGGAANGGTLSVGTGGISEDGGNGGPGNTASSTRGGDGVAPGGAGGGSANDGGGGNGAVGRVRVWTLVA